MKNIGHRGARGLAPENTIAGLRKALEHQVDAVEFDVRITRDSIAVLVHDALARDATGTTLRVRDSSYAELKAHKPDLPTLEEAIRFVDKRVPVIIELKPGEATAPVVKVVRGCLEAGWSPSDIQFISFNYPILKVLHRAFPEHLIIVDEMWSSIRATFRARRLGTRHISLYDRFMWSGFVRALSRRGYSLYAFPLNEPAKAKRWAAVGLYGAITDYPDRFQK